MFINEIPYLFISKAEDALFLGLTEVIASYTFLQLPRAVKQVCLPFALMSVSEQGKVISEQGKVSPA